eukprot:gene11085-12345_t
MSRYELVERFLECAVHTLLHSREIYPSALFEQRRFLGVLVWQCVHPEVLAYLHRVFDNFRPLLRDGLMEKLVMSTSMDQKVVDHVTIKCHFVSPDNSGPLPAMDQALLEEELRSAILRLAMTDSSLGKVSE